MRRRDELRVLPAAWYAALGQKQAFVFYIRLFATD